MNFLNAPQKHLRDAIKNPTIISITKLITTSPHIAYRLISGLESTYRTPVLILAARRRDHTLIQLLLARRLTPNLNVRDHTRGETALHIAVRNRDIRIAKLLLNHGARTDIADASGTTAFHVAVDEGVDSMVRVFLEYGVDVDYQTRGGDTAVHLAVKCRRWTGRAEGVGVLLEGIVRRADLRRVDGNGQTAIHVAADGPDPNVVRVLLGKGGKVGSAIDVKDGSGDTAIMIAQRMGCDEVFGLLKRRGAEIVIS